jgi:1-acyl-sn-glycerol-3-phosphate acyltransferase
LGIFSTATIIGILLIAGMLTTFKVRWKLGYAWCAIIGWMTKVFCGLTFEVEGMGNAGITIYSAAAFSGDKA